MAKKHGKSKRKGGDNQTPEFRKDPARRKTSSFTSNTSSRKIIIGSFLAAVTAITYKYAVSSPGSSSMSSRFATPEVRDLVEWIKQHRGLIHEYIAVREGPFGRGVFLDGGSITADDSGSLYQVPEECYFFLPNLEKKSKHLAPLFSDELFQNIDHDSIKLGIALLAERNNPESFWKPYLATIPHSYPEQPLFWTPDQLDELQSASLVRQFQKSNDWLEKQAEGLHQLVERHPKLFGPYNTTADFAWAYYTITSRAFDVSRADGEQLGDAVHTALLPFVDLLNHAFTESNRTVEHYFAMEMPHKKLLYAGRATRDELPRGTELQWKYKDDGQYSAYYLYRHGMIPPYPDGDFIMLRYEENAWPVSHEGHMHQAIFGEDKNMSLQHLTNKVKSAIDNLPTTLGEDLLAESSLALEVRIRYKRILHKLLTWLQEGALEHDDEILISERQAGHALYELDVNN